MGAAIDYGKPKAARWTIDFVPTKGWRLVDPSGKPQSALYASKERVLTALEAAQARTDATLKRITRSCMCCRSPFESEGIHHRMCARCRGQNADGWNPYGLAPRSGRPR